MVFNGELWELVLWLAIIMSALVLLAMLVAWMVQARARRTLPKHRWDKRVPHGVTGRNSEGAR
ncbi:MAG: hypothetical protein ACT4NY_30315 [Pseudonocardiales bacterium]